MDTKEDRVAASTATAESAPAELLDLLRRERAEFLNYKRRIERERGEDRERARADTVARILPLLDDLDRALARVPDELSGHPWTRGVALCRRQLLEALSELGIERVGEVGEPFDASLHEAVQYEPSPDADQPRVAAVHRAGYRIGGRLLRPAQVAVAGPGGVGSERTGRRGRARREEPSGPPRKRPSASDEAATATNDVVTTFTTPDLPSGKAPTRCTAVVRPAMRRLLLPLGPGDD